MRTQTISKSKFKSRALEYFRHVERTHEPLVITDHGRPTLKIIPYHSDPDETLHQLKDSVVRYGDPIDPVGMKDWDALK